MYKQKINDLQYYEFTKEKGTVVVTKAEVMTKGRPGIDYKTKLIANVWPIVKANIEVKEGDDTNCYAECDLMFANSPDIKNVRIPIMGIKKLDWITLSPQCILNPESTKAAEHLANIVLLACQSAPVKTSTLVDRTHLFMVEGTPVYHVGDRLIWPEGIEGEPKVVFVPLSDTRLSVDSDCSEREAFDGMERIANLSEINGFLLAFCLLYIQREAYISAGITPRCCAKIIAPTGYKKTTVGSFSTQIFNRDKPLEPPSRLDSSEAAAVNRLYERDNIVVMLDDLIEKKMEQVLHFTLRVVSDGIEPGRMRGQKIAKAPPQCGLLYTGEYYFNRGWGSDAARILPLKLDAPIDSDKLSACQQEPLMLSTFIDYYIRWYVTNYEMICSRIKGWVVASRNTKASCHPRLAEMQVCFEVSMKLYLTYAEDRGFIPLKTAHDRYQAYEKQLRRIIKEQNDRVNNNPNDPNRKRSELDYLEIIRLLFKENRFCLTSCIGDFSPDIYDGVIHGDYVCFNKTNLFAKIQKKEPTADRFDLVKHLLDRGALRPDTNSATRKLHGCKHRLLHIRRAML